MLRSALHSSRPCVFCIDFLHNSVVLEVVVREEDIGNDAIRHAFV
jgi:hypothetical protein